MKQFIPSPSKQMKGSMIRQRSMSHSPEKVLNSKRKSEDGISSIPDSQEFKRFKECESPLNSNYAGIKDDV
jgi:hypothetical protein